MVGNGLSKCLFCSSARASENEEKAHRDETRRGPLHASRGIRVSGTGAVGSESITSIGKLEEIC